VAIGETGLDGVGERRARLADQEVVFRAQLALARERRLPLMLHILDAHGRAFEILRGDGVPSGGVIHSYSGSAEMARDYLALGLSLSFAGSVTHPGAKRARAAAAVVPRDRLLVETDAPDQTPAPHRPGLNEPAYLGTIVSALAAARGEPAEEVARGTEGNARRLFGV
jgi:TatD DNase family protein